MAHEADVRGVAVADQDPSVPAVVLEARDGLLPVFISAGQARSIQHALDGEPFERPLTHDVFVEMIAEFGGAIDRVRIDDVQDGTFYGKLDAEQYHGGERKQLVFDVRPSDAVALALRVDCPIEVSDDVLDAAGYAADEINFQRLDDD
jgi:bifunctional DNase/RNase